MTYEELIERLDPSVYQNLRKAIELGKWPDGRALSKEQRAICVEAVIYYEARHNIPEHERTGYIDRRKAEDKSDGSDNDTSPIRILN
ncbi:MAG: DUF1315 family protein [Oleiphilaceae bacterium]|nr:DUF1315 family protein [Oleiphilaceae bacterium]